MGSCCSAQHKTMENEPIKISTMSKMPSGKNIEKEVHSQIVLEESDKVEPKACIEKSNSQEIQSKETGSISGIHPEVKKDPCEDNLNESKFLSDIKPEQNVIAPINDLKEVNPFNISRINENKSFNKNMNSDRNQNEIPSISNEKGGYEINHIPMNMPDQASLIEELKQLENACPSSFDNKEEQHPKSNAIKYPSLIVVDTVLPENEAGKLDLNPPTRIEVNENNECEIEEENMFENNPPCVNNKISYPHQTKLKSSLDKPLLNKDKRQILKDVGNVGYLFSQNKNGSSNSEHPFS